MTPILKDLICANKTISYAFDETLTNDLARGAFELYQCFFAIKCLFSSFHLYHVFSPKLRTSLLENKTENK